MHSGNTFSSPFSVSFPTPNTRPAQNNAFGRSVNFSPISAGGTLPADKVFESVLRSLLPCDWFGLSTVALPPASPLSVDGHDRLYFDPNRWKIDGISRVELDPLLRKASELRNQVRLISTFVHGSLRRIDFCKHESPLLSSKDLEAPVKNFLARLLEELTEMIAERGNNSYQNLAALQKFLRSLRNVFSDNNFSLFDRFLTCAESIEDFWIQFIKSLNFSHFDDPQNSRVALFEGLIHLVAIYLERRLELSEQEDENSTHTKVSPPSTLNSNSPSTTPEKIAFIESLWKDDPFLQGQLKVASKWTRIAPQNRSLELRGLKETLLAHWMGCKAKERVRYTQFFIVQLVRNALNEFVDHLNSVLLVELGSGDLLAEHLKQIQGVYSINAYELEHSLGVGSEFVPPFSCKTDFRENRPFVGWTQVEAELRRKLVGSTSDGGDNNVLCKRQHWALSVAFSAHFYNTLDRTFLRLYRLVHSLHAISESACARRNGIWLAKERLRLQLSTQLGGLLQIFIQIFQSWLKQTNVVGSAALLEQLVGSSAAEPRASVKGNLLMELVDCWQANLDQLLYVLDELLHEPVEELHSICEEFCGKREEAGVELEDDGTDLEVARIANWLQRLRRVRLFVHNQEWDWAAAQRRSGLGDGREMFNRPSDGKLPIPAKVHRMLRQMVQP